MYTGEPRNVSINVAAEAEERRFRSMVQQNLPQHVQFRLQPRLVQAEWSTTTCLAEDLGPQGGVALVKKQEVPNVLRNVGTTSQPTAMLTTQPPWELHLPGYTSTMLTCTLKVIGENGGEQFVEVQRWLTQLGMGQAVSMETEGLVVIQELVTMRKMTFHFDSTEGWREIRVSNVADLLKQLVGPDNFAQIVVREQGCSATAFVLHSEVDKVLRSSGRGHVYAKMHPDETGRYTCVLFLPMGTSYRLVMDMAQQLGEVALGIVKKTGGAAPRFGIRFGKDEDMAKFAATQGLTEQATIGRYKITGTTPQMGPEGVKVMMMNSIQWEIREVLFMSDTATVVTALTNPSVNKLALRRAGGAQTILHIKAMNATAKEAFRKAKMSFRTADAEGEDQDTAKAIAEDDDAWHKRRVHQRHQSPKRHPPVPGGGLPPAQRPRLGTQQQLQGVNAGQPSEQQETANSGDNGPPDHQM